MEKAESEALSNILGELATKADLRSLDQKVDARFDSIEHKFDGKLERLKSDLTWWMTAAVVFLATAMTLLDQFID